MNDASAKVIKQYQVCEDGANVPTQVTEYVCPCGKGKIVYERVGGFNDSYAYIDCEDCKKLYDVWTGAGNLWQLVKKK